MWWRILLLVIQLRMLWRLHQLERAILLHARVAGKVVAPAGGKNPLVLYQRGYALVRAGWRLIKTPTWRPPGSDLTRLKIMQAYEEVNLGKN